MLKIINRVKSAHAQHSGATTGASGWQTAMMAILKTLVSKPAQRSDPPSFPLPFFPYSPPFPWKHLKEHFDPYRQNHVLTHVWEMNPMCLQNLRYKVVAEG